MGQMATGYPKNLFLVRENIDFVGLSTLGLARCSFLFACLFHDVLIRVVFGSR